MDQKTASQTGGASGGQWNPLDHTTQIGGILPTTNIPWNVPKPCPTCGSRAPNTFTVPGIYPTIPSSY